MNQRLSRIWLLAGALSVCGFTLACESGGGGDDEDVDERDGSRPDTGTDPGLDTGTNPGLDLGLVDTSTDTSVPAEDGISCGDIIQCINGTGGTEAEVQGCISQGTPTGQSLIQDVFVCLQTNCASATTDEAFQACQQEFCAPDINACAGDTSDGSEPTPIPGDGDLECGEIVQCINTGGGTQQSIQQCQAQGTADGVAELNSLLQCLQTNCAGLEEAAFQTCQQENCATELAACFDQPVPAGSDTCREVISCLANATSQAAGDACIADGSAAGASQAAALYSCAAAGCQSSANAAAFETCMLESTACSAEAAACQ